MFARSGNDKPTGWVRAFRAHPQGRIQFGGEQVRVRAAPVRSRRLRDAVSTAFGEKYNMKASRKWVQGFAEPERVVNTIEFIAA